MNVNAYNIMVKHALYIQSTKLCMNIDNFFIMYSGGSSGE